ncbi:MAG: hypothetical protein JW797_14405 [Bradymonadales bacterium]|nr:hypothetical protein [Bradymonadales bacterium]
MIGAALLVFGLFLLGMVLIAAEAFIIPGFGITGVIGAALVAVSAIYAWSSLNPILGLTLGGVALVLSLGFFLVMPRTRLGQRLTLKEAISEGSGYGDDARRAGIQVGQRGITATDLKPSGFALFDEARIEVRSDGEWLNRDTEVVVTELKDGKVIVTLPED